MRLLLVVLSLVAAAIAPPLSAETDLFAYDRSAPLNLHEVGKEQRGAATIHDITFVGTKTPVKAYLVTPAIPGPHAAILYVHWLGEPKTTNRTEFLDEAVKFAGQGVVSLLVDAMWAEPDWYGKRIPEEDYDRSVRQVIELRRALDVLSAQPGIDPHRIALVAHDFGAMYGLIAGALDKRPKTYVFMAAVPHFIDWHLFDHQPKNPKSYQKQMAPLDPVNFTSQLARASVFFQFAHKDKYVSATQAAEFYAATSPRIQMATYEGGHDLHTAEVAADRGAWLT